MTSDVTARALRALVSGGGLDAFVASASAKITDSTADMHALAREAAELLPVMKSAVERAQACRRTRRRIPDGLRAELAAIVSRWDGLATRLDAAAALAETFGAREAAETGRVHAARARQAMAGLLAYASDTPEGMRS